MVVIAHIGTQVYSRGDEPSLPTNDNNLENLFTSQEYADVATSNDVRVAQTATDEYALFEFKDKNDNSTDEITPSWEGQSDLAPSSSTIFLQIFNRTSGAWETLDSESAEVANTDFTLSGTQSTNLSNYYDADNFVSCRVYQEAA